MFGRTAVALVMPALTPNRVLVASVLSPDEPPIAKASASVKTTRIVRRLIKAAPTAVFSQLPPELLTLVLRCAAENDHTFIVHGGTCKQWCECVRAIQSELDWASPGWWVGSRAALQPILDQADMAFLASCEPCVKESHAMTFDALVMGHDSVPLVDCEDLSRVLGKSHDGWFNNFGIDAFMAWLVMCGPEAARTVKFSNDVLQVNEGGGVYLPCNVSYYVRTRGADAAATENTPWCSEQSARLLRAAPLIYWVYGSNDHWAPMVVNKRGKCILIIDPLGLTGAPAAADMLTFLSRLTGDASLLQYKVCRRSIPKQLDSSSCGAFACVIMYHVLCQARVKFTHADMPAWRRFIAAKIKCLHASYGA